MAFIPESSRLISLRSLPQLDTLQVDYNLITESRLIFRLCSFSTRTYSSDVQLRGLLAAPGLYPSISVG